jgi:hypothetical protein
MGKQSHIRAVRALIRKEGGVSKRLVAELSRRGETLILRSDKRTVKIQRA